MNRVVSFLQHYLVIIAVLIGISILLSITFSNFIVTSSNHKAAEMYIGELKYSMEIDGSSTNTLTVPTGETIIDVKVNNLNPVDTYYKLLYLKNTNITVKYYESTKDTDDVVTTYNKPNDSITSSNSNTLKLLITNNSASSQNIAFTMKGGYITNTLEDITTPSTYSEITLADTSTNTYFCTTTDTLTQGLKYVNGHYTYAYKQEGKATSSGLDWNNISRNGWGVQLTNKSSTDAVTSKVCTYINNKPITSMRYMFCDSQATTIDVSHFDTRNVENMYGMFWNSKATTLDVSNFDTSKVTNMKVMFYDSQATTLDLSNFDTSNVTNMSYMFRGSQAITLDVSNFNTSNVIDMRYMFYDSKATILDVSKFNTSKVTNMMNMFSNSQATVLDVSNFNTSNVTNMYGMFFGSQATTLDVSNFDTSNVTTMESMFQYSKATTLDLSSFDTSNVTDMTEMFNYASKLKTIHVSDKFNTDNVTSSNSMFTGSTNLVGGAGTTYNSSYVDKTYAHIDGGTSNPGYFTDIADKDIPKPNSFATDSWKTIAKAVRSNNISKYNVGDTRTIDMGTYGTHTLRLSNKSTPSECSTTGFSQSACGFVLEFADIITTHVMNDTNTNVGGWPASSMYTFVNNDIYNALPSEIKNAIIDTVTVSGHGPNDTANFTSTDKLYLLSTAEVWAQGSSNTINYDTARDNTRQLDYYKNLGTSTSNYSGTIKKNGTSATWWWLRAANSSYHDFFYPVSDNGDWANSEALVATHGVSPAFRIG